jgi:hypothetical protein
MKALPSYYLNQTENNEYQFKCFGVTWESQVWVSRWGPEIWCRLVPFDYVIRVERKMEEARSSETSVPVCHIIVSYPDDPNLVLETV